MRTVRGGKGEGPGQPPVKPDQSSARFDLIFVPTAPRRLYHHIDQLRAREPSTRAHGMCEEAACYLELTRGPHYAPPNNDLTLGPVVTPLRRQPVIVTMPIVEAKQRSGRSVERALPGEVQGHAQEG